MEYLRLLMPPFKSYQLIRFTSNTSEEQVIRDMVFAHYESDKLGLLSFILVERIPNVYIA